MRTTVRIDDDLLRELKERAHQEGVSMAKLFDRAVRAGLKVLKNGENAPRKPYREKTFSTGVPFVDLTKANQLAAKLEDEERLRKMQLSK